MKYDELKNRQREEVYAFPIGAAFTEGQFSAMMEKFGLGADDTKAVAHIGGGCYIRRADIPAFNAMSEKHEAEMRAFLATEDGLRSALIDELRNHECQFTGDMNPALHALGLPDEDKLDAETASRVKKIWAEYWSQCVKNGWF